MEIFLIKKNNRKNLNFIAVCQHTHSVCVFFKQKTTIESKLNRIYLQEHLL